MDLLYYMTWLISRFVRFGPKFIKSVSLELMVSFVLHRKLKYKKRAGNDELNYSGWEVSESVLISVCLCYCYVSSDSVTGLQKGKRKRRWIGRFAYCSCWRRAPWDWWGLQCLVAKLLGRCPVDSIGRATGSWKVAAKKQGETEIQTFKQHSWKTLLAIKPPIIISVACLKKLLFMSNGFCGELVLLRKKPKQNQI